MLVVLLVIADPARMSLGSWWLNCYVNLLTAGEMVQCHILAAGIVLDDLVTGSYCFSSLTDAVTLPVEIVYTIGVVGACGAVENFMCWAVRGDEAAVARW
ncbi:hypothetical protein Nepgr_023051 [Nepenthes gracilis]|uniref:Uncharacterized protein n=1 Tax=Nepenthes gracilis TaxID=150966 RepID=A0AAD3XYN9_NEPGR|nr:hypothetical protein Nepgr_023051 [Nepenthes gracilis]